MPQIPFKGQAFETDIHLESQGTPGTFQANPTLATGDVKVVKDNGAENNLTTLPTVSPASGKTVRVQLSATEMDADKVTVIFSDAAGSEWYDHSIIIHTLPFAFTASAVNDVSATTTSFVTDLTETTNDHYNDLFLVFTSGALLGQSRKISDYDGTTKTITLATALTDSPADNDEFIIIGRSE